MSAGRKPNSSETRLAPARTATARHGRDMVQSADYMGLASSQSGQYIQVIHSDAGRLHSLHMEMGKVLQAVEALQVENERLKGRILKDRRLHFESFFDMNAKVVLHMAFLDWKREARLGGYHRRSKEGEVLRESDAEQYERRIQGNRELCRVKLGELRLKNEDQFASQETQIAKQLQEIQQMYAKRLAEKDSQLASVRSALSKLEEEAVEMRLKVQVSEGAVVQIKAAVQSRPEQLPDTSSELPSDASSEYVRSRIHELLKDIDPKYLGRAMTGLTAQSGVGRPILVQPQRR